MLRARCPEVQVVEHEVVGGFAVDDIRALVGGLDRELADLQALVLECTGGGRLDVFDRDGVVFSGFRIPAAKTGREGERNC